MTFGDKKGYGGLCERQSVGVGRALQKENSPTPYSDIYLLGGTEGEKC